jgi:hypothetical protein
MEALGKSLPGDGVGVNNGGVLGCRGPPWRRFVGMASWLGLCLPGENLSPVFGGATTTASTLFPSFLGASL